MLWNICQTKIDFAQSLTISVNMKAGFQRRQVVE